jgi:1,4-dihydroxy-2-naphthoyl-CoA hydrolase
MIPESITLEYLNQFGKGNMGEHLDIVFTEVCPDYIVARMPVDHRTRQPFGVLHGGASAVLAETVGSIAGNCCVASDDKYCVGLEINANHLRPVKEGFVHAKASVLHLGGKTQVWDIKITNDEGKLICVSRLTLAVLSK